LDEKEVQVWPNGPQQRIAALLADWAWSRGPGLVPGRSCAFAVIRGMLVTERSRGYWLFPRSDRQWTPVTLPSFLRASVRRHRDLPWRRSLQRPTRASLRVAFASPARVDCRPPHLASDSSTRAPLVRTPRARVPFSTCRPRRSVREEPPLGPSRFGVGRPPGTRADRSVRPCGFHRLASRMSALRDFGDAAHVGLLSRPGRDACAPRQRSWDSLTLRSVDPVRFG